MSIGFCCNLKKSLQKHRPIGEVVKDIAIGARGHGFDSWAGQIIGHGRQRLITAATFLRSSCYVAQAKSSEDGPRHSLPASALYREYNEDFFYCCKVLLMRYFV